MRIKTNVDSLLSFPAVLRPQGLPNTKVSKGDKRPHTVTAQEALCTNLSTSQDSVVLTNTELGNGT